jgi:Ca2+-binding RTX toxin-like protein
MQALTSSLKFGELEPSELETMRSRTPSPRGRLGIALLLAVCLGILMALPAAASAASCGGKHETIVSNAPRIVGTEAHDVIVAGSASNAIYGVGGSDTICGSGGNDRIHGDRGNDTIFGGKGEDTIVGERGSDGLDGGPGADRLFGETGNDEIDGGAEGDEIDGGAGDDSVSGGRGNFDIVFGGVGSDLVDGGPGAHDIASYRSVGGPISVDLGTGTVSGAEQEQADGVEDVLGGSGDDTLTGSTAPNRLDGGSGSDHLVAVGYGDKAFGGIGSDACSGTFAAETACGAKDGGNGTAIAMISSITGATSLVVSGSEGPDDVTVNFTGDGYLLQGGNSIEVVLDDLESNACVRSEAANSVLCRGGAGAIQVSLKGGDDTFTVAGSVPADIAATIDGGEGPDTLRGGRGNDTIYGGDDQDPDTLEGGGGDDVLYGVNIFHPRKDSGAAHMSGGAGDDLLIGAQPCDGDTFGGGEGDNDSASFARVRNSGTNVKAQIGGAVVDPDVGGCNAGHIGTSVEKIEGSPGNDMLIGDDSHGTLLGRGGDDDLDGRGGFDRCIEGGGSDRLTNCEFDSFRIPLRKRIR